MSISFYSTITLGTLIHLGGVIFAGFLAYMKIHERIGRLEDKVDLLMKWFRTEVIPEQVRLVKEERPWFRGQKERG